MSTTSSSSSPLDPRVISQHAQTGIDQLKSTAHSTVDRVAEAASSTADRLGARTEEWIATKDDWVDTARGYVREHPVPALAMAFVAGYLLSRLAGR